MQTTAGGQPGRRPKGEHSVFQRRDNGKCYYKIKFKLGRELRELREEIPGDHKDATAWKAAKNIRNECLARITRKEVAPSNVENVACDERLNDYVNYLKRDVPEIVEQQPWMASFLDGFVPRFPAAQDSRTWAGPSATVTRLQCRVDLTIPWGPQSHWPSPLIREGSHGNQWAQDGRDDPPL